MSRRDASADAVYVAALGASTPIGRDPWSAAAAVRSGISGFAHHPYMIDTTGEPMQVAPAPWLDIGLTGAERFEVLLMPAIEQALAPLAEADSSVRVALALGLPLSRPGLPDNLEGHLRDRIKEQFKGRFGAIAVFSAGHAAGLLGLHAAFPKLTADAFDTCVIAGVESYLSPDTLHWLEANEQVHGAGPLNNAWGFIPGEAAGAALLASGRALQRLGLDALAQILSVGTAVEPNRIKTETVCIGEGLTAAFRAGLIGLAPGSQVTDVFCDMNGEPYRADEFGFATLRTKEAFVAASDFVAPADCWGDVSAAGVPLHIALAAIAGTKNYANGTIAFVWASSESGERGAVLLATATAAAG